MKEPVRGEIAPKKISHIQFGLLSANEMERLSEFQVYRSDLFTMPQVRCGAVQCIRGIGGLIEARRYRRDEGGRLSLTHIRTYAHMHSFIHTAHPGAQLALGPAAGRVGQDLHLLDLQVRTPRENTWD